MPATVLEVQPAILTSPGGTVPGRVQWPVVPPASGRNPSRELLLACEQLSHLASLHHQSDYSRMKYGPNGALSIYVPLSVHFPDQVEQLKDLQATCTLQKAWWFSSNEPLEQLKQVDPPRQISPKEPILSRAHTSIELQAELEAALTSSLSLEQAVAKSSPPPNSPSTMRTSETHPIGISTMIPPELLHMISSRINRSGYDRPSIFDVPLACQLHRLLFRSRDSHGRSSSTGSLPPPSNSRNSRSDRSHTLSSATSSATLLSTISATAATARVVVPPPSKPSSFVSLLWAQSFLRKAVMTATFGHRRSECRHSLAISSPVSHEETRRAGGRNALDLPAVGNMMSANEERNLAKETLRAAPAVDLFPDDMVLERNGEPVEDDLLHMPAPSQGGLPRATLGNLFLSSCPGKKVRLTGPVKGRGAVCRDLAQDLQRMMDMGVRCIVCCLGDTELDFLGASWAEYSRLADEIGLDVLRIPIPEGLAPLDVVAFDKHLTRLIDTYTLCGRHVLVHCRGGVGRAGLVACCWTIKLGLCGWIETETESCSFADDATTIQLCDGSGAGVGVGGGSASGCDDAVGNKSPSQSRSSISSVVPVKRETLQLVQRVLAVVRKQRSPKAIETFEQVKFLVDYVEHLRLLKGTTFRSNE